ncbi:Uncharacterised protein [uncultured archaeon]|nr:Uncharacterised protein [uncultured archaeon]
MWLFNKNLFKPGTAVRIKANPHRGQEGVVLTPEYGTRYGGIPKGAVPVGYGNRTRLWFWENELEVIKP